MKIYTNLIVTYIRKQSIQMNQRIKKWFLGYSNIGIRCLYLQQKSIGKYRNHLHLNYFIWVCISDIYYKVSFDPMRGIITDQKTQLRKYWMCHFLQNQSGNLPKDASASLIYYRGEKFMNKIKAGINSKHPKSWCCCGRKRV